jgi:hypothetical protein
LHGRRRPSAATPARPTGLVTGCLYASPEFEPGNPQGGVLPVLMADTMATLVAPPPDAKPIIPATFTSEGPSTVRLCRKLHIIDPAALACAGVGERIEEFLAEMERELPTKLLELDRPMRWVGDIAVAQNARYRAQYRGSAALNVVGCTPTRDDMLNHVTPDGTFDTKSFGMCGVTGSGGSDLRRLVEEFDKSYSRPAGASAWDVARTLAGGINGERLGDEILGEAENHWGGYVEWAAYDARAVAWRRGPRTLNLFFVADADENDIYDIRLVHRAIAYDPGDKVGRVMSLTSIEQIRPVEFLLQPLTEAALPEETDATKFWSEWQPEVCTVMVMTLSREGWRSNLSKSLVGDVLGQVVFRYSKTERTFGVRQPFLNDVLEQLFTFRGFKHRPQERATWMTLS